MRSSRRRRSRPPSASRLGASISATANGGRERSMPSSHLRTSEATRAASPARTTGARRRQRDDGDRVESRGGCRLDTRRERVRRERDEGRVIADVAPERGERGMDENAPLHRRQPLDRFRPRFGPEPESRRRAERAIALRLDECRAASRLAAVRERRRAIVADRLPGRSRRELHARGRRRRRGRGAERGCDRDEPRHRSRVVVGPFRVRKDHFGRPARPLLRQRLRVRELAGRRRARHVVLPLPRQRQQRIRARCGRPDFGREAGDPQRIERQPRRFEQSQDFDRCARRFGLEHVFVRQRDQRRHRLARRDAPGHGSERCELREQIVPGAPRLPLGRRQRAVSGPAGRREPRAPEFGPFARCAVRGPAQTRARRSPAVRQRAIDGGKRTDRVVERDVAPAVAKPIGFELPPGAASRRAPPQRTASAAVPPRGPWEAARARGRSGRAAAERIGTSLDRVAKRQVVRTDGVLAPGPLQRRAEDVLGERADLVAARRKILDGDADRRAGIGKRAFACPAERARDFIARRTARGTPQRSGRIAHRCAMPDLHPRRSERGKEALLLRRELDETRQRHRCAAPDARGRGTADKPVRQLCRVQRAARRENPRRTRRPTARTPRSRRRPRPTRASCGPPAPHAWTNDQASAASAAAPCSSISDNPSEATIRFHRYAPCAEGKSRGGATGLSEARTSSQRRSSQPFHGMTTAADHTARPAARCASSWIAASRRARRLFGVTTVVPEASAARSGDGNASHARAPVTTLPCYRWQTAGSGRGAAQARQRCRKEALRFSTKARIPSFWSSVANSE